MVFSGTDQSCWSHLGLSQVAVIYLMQLEAVLQSPGGQYPGGRDYNSGGRQFKLCFLVGQTSHVASSRLISGCCDVLDALEALLQYPGNLNACRTCSSSTIDVTNMLASSYFYGFAIVSSGCKL